MNSIIGVIIIFITYLGLIPFVYTVHAQDTEEGGVLDLFDGVFDSNLNISFVPGENMLGAYFGELRTTPGLRHEVNNTDGNRTQFVDPNSKSIQEYDSNSSDWTKIDPFDKGRAD